MVCKITIPVSYTHLDVYKRQEQLGVRINDIEFLNKIEDLKQTLLKYNVPRRNVCIVSGAVIQVLGLRKSSEFDDIDIITVSYTHLDDQNILQYSGRTKGQYL